MSRSSPPRVTLRDVANEAGCSKAVASAVLNGSRSNIGASQDLRRRVQETARRLGYVTNFASQSLALKRTRTLGVYIDPLHGGGIAGHYHAAMLSGIEAAAVEHRYDVLLVNFAGDATVAGCVEKISQARIDGLLLLHTGRNETLIDALLEATSLLVAIDTLDPPDRLQAVSFDHEHAVRLAVQHLVSLGHRRLGYAGPHVARSIPHNVARVEALRRAAVDAGLPLPESVLLYSENETRDRRPTQAFSAQRVLQRYLALPRDERPSALVVYNDRLAADLIAHLAEAGLSVPGDMSLINFENTPISQVTHPALTCLEHPVTEMAHRGTARLIDLIESDQEPAPTASAEPWHHVFPSALIVRGSTAPPRTPSTLESSPEISFLEESL